MIKVIYTNKAYNNEHFLIEEGDTVVAYGMNEHGKLFGIDNGDLGKCLKVEKQPTETVYTVQWAKSGNIDEIGSFFNSYIRADHSNQISQIEERTW